MNRSVFVLFISIYSSRSSQKHSTAILDPSLSLTTHFQILKILLALPLKCIPNIELLLYDLAKPSPGQITVIVS